MPNFGDPILPDRCVLADYIERDMPTAIVRTYTDDGFVIAADGRVCNSSSGEPTKENMQKVFRLGSQPLAYSFTGAAMLGRADSHDSDEVLFDFIERFRCACQMVSARRFPTLQKYAERLSSIVYRSLQEALASNNIDLPEDGAEASERGHTIVNIQIDGYFAGYPSRAKIRYWHENQNLSEPDVITQELMPMTPELHGIPEIAKRIYRRDPELAHYLRPLEPESHYSNAIIFAAIYARAFIEACAGPEGAKVAPAKSATINNRIHIAIITPRDGFQWLQGFEPAPI
jgi:hypothetical protein